MQSSTAQRSAARVRYKPCDLTLVSPPLRSTQCSFALLCITVDYIPDWLSVHCMPLPRGAQTGAAPHTPPSSDKRGNRTQTWTNACIMHHGRRACTCFALATATRYDCHANMCKLWKAFSVQPERRRGLCDGNHRSKAPHLRPHRLKPKRLLVKRRAHPCID